MTNEYMTYAVAAICVVSAIFSAVIMAFQGRPKTWRQWAEVILLSIAIGIMAFMTAVLIFSLKPLVVEASDNDYDDDAIMITEVAWAGTLAHPDHEWFELYNNTADPMHLEGWTLKLFYADRAGYHTIYIPETTIEPYEYVVFEREHDGVLSTPASGIYTDTIGMHNSGVQEIMLANAEHHLRDLWMFPAGGEWPYGNYDTKATAAFMMDEWDWGTEVEVSDVEDANGDFIIGSPWVASTSALDHGGQGLVLMTEIAWAGTHASTSDEWFELYNNSDEPRYLIDWKLAIFRPPSGSDPTYIHIPAVILEPGEYALFERTDDETIPNRTAKATYSGSLPNTDVYAIALVDSVGLFQHLWGWYGSEHTTWPTGSNSGKTSAHYFIGGQQWTTSNYSTGARDGEGNLIFGSPGEANHVYWFSYHNYLPIAAGAEVQDE